MTAGDRLIRALHHATILKRSVISSGIENYHLLEIINACRLKNLYTDWEVLENYKVDNLFQSKVLIFSLSIIHSSTKKEKLLDYKLVLQK